VLGHAVRRDPVICSLWPNP